MSTSSYRPSILIRSMHLLPHLSSDLESTSNTFAITQDSLWNDYTESLLTFPIIIAFLGIFVLILLATQFVFRCCFQSCKFAPDEINLANSSVDTAVKWIDRIAGTRNSLSRRFLYFCLFILIADHIVFIGGAFLSRGIEKGDNALEFLEVASMGLTTAAYKLQEAGTSFNTNLNNGLNSCPDLYNNMNNYKNVINDYSGYVNTFAEIAKPLPYYVSAFRQSFDEWFVNKKNASVWALYTVIVVQLAIFYGGIRIQSKPLVQLAICFSFIIMASFIVLCCLEMSVLMGLADFCMSPTTYVLAALSNDDVKSVVGYYTSCQGSSPLDEPLAQAVDSVVLVNSSLAYLQGPDSACAGDVYVKGMQTNILTAHKALQDILEHTNCGTIQGHVSAVLEDGMCASSYLGVFLIWLGQFGTLFFLFLLTFVVSVLYQYFGDYWTLEKEEILAASLEENDPFRVAGSIHAPVSRSSMYQPPNIHAYNTQYRPDSANTAQRKVAAMEVETYNELHKHRSPERP